MPHAEHTVTVNRPPREIFDYLADGTHNRAWRAGVLEIERTSPADGEGAAYRVPRSVSGGAGAVTARAANSIWGWSASRQDGAPWR
jgi:hypothetical protein